MDDASGSTMRWGVTTALLCLYGFLKEVRPSEPFLTEYLIDPSGPNVTLSEAWSEVYPVWTYSYLAILVPVFLFTDLLRYKPVIVFEGFAYVGTWVLLLWGKGVGMMQLMQVVYGVATSTEIAYYTYIYAKVEPKYFQRVTSFTRVSLLLGRFISGVLAQVLNSTGLLSYRDLNYVTLASVSAATAVAFLLPGVERTRYFHTELPSPAPPAPPQEVEEAEHGRGKEREAMLNEETQIAPVGGGDDDKNGGGRTSLREVVTELKLDFLAAYSSPYVAKWSLWWALGMCGNFQVGNYIQPLWETIEPVQDAGEGHIYNGAVEAITTLAGACLSFAFGFVRANWSLLGEPVLFVLSASAGAVLAAMASTSHIVVAYGGYVAFRALYQMLITVASYEVAQNIRDTSYGLVFGVNTFVALAFQTALTMAVADDSVGFSLPPRQQFLVYGAFWAGVGLLFLVIFFFGVCGFEGGWRAYVERVRQEGLWARGAAEDREAMHGEGNVAEERRDVPLGTTEPL